MKGLECTITGSKLTIKEINKIISNGRNQFEVDFNFGDDWNGLLKYAVFSVSGKETINCAINNSTCLIPTEFLKDNLTIQIGVYGVSDDKTYTTNIRSVKVECGTVTTGKSADIATISEWETYLINVNTAVDEVKTNAESVSENTETVRLNTEKTNENVNICTEKANVAIEKAQISTDNANLALESKTVASQALSDLLAMLGTDIATLVGGKIPASQIPSIATTEIYTATSQTEMDELEVQNGDICVRSDENKSYLYSDGWVYLASPTDYCETAGTATTAQTAVNSTMINNKRIISMTAEQYDSAVLDDDTFYFVSEFDEEEETHD